MKDQTLMRAEPNDEMTPSASEAYHVATRNPSTTKRFFKAHEIHYEPRIQRLAAEAPTNLHIGRAIPWSAELLDLNVSLDRAILQRRSIRGFSGSNLSPSELSTLLFYSCGIQAVSRLADDRNSYYRNVANSGNLGSCEIFVIALNVDDLPPGIYHYDSLTAGLSNVRSGQYQQWLGEFVLYQSELASAAALMVVVGAVGRLKSKYGERGYRLALLDAGHVSQNVYLIATALGLSVCATAGFIDEELDRALRIDGLDYASMLVLGLGHRNEIDAQL
jgi:SagB-type dehydrogenase family enzyme